MLTSRRRPGRPGRLNKPWYLFRPAQALRRVHHALRQPGQTATTTLPWGLPLAYDPREVIGSSIARTGVYELAVSELVHRLAEPGETAVDAGANIGYVTSILAARLGADGEVIAVEPHPDLFRQLAGNAVAWARHPGVARVTLHRLALSDRNGRGRLFTDERFASNRGTASLAGPVGDSEGRCIHEVALARLGDLVNVPRIGVLKLDVEGHELSVLAGARDLLSSHRIRDIVFEEHENHPTPVTSLLEGLGYRIYEFTQSPLRLSLGSPSSGSKPPSWEAPGYLATVDPGRAERRLRRPGWAVLAPRLGLRRRRRSSR